MSRFNVKYLSDELVEQFFCALLEQRSLVYLIIDGLDECQNEKNMRETLFYVATAPRRGMPDFNLKLNEIGDSSPIDFSDIDDRVRSCDGSFVYAKFLMDTLGGEGITCYADIPKVLHEFPQSLNGYFVRTLLKLCEKSKIERSLVRRTFMFLIGSIQSITWRELLNALAIEHGATHHCRYHVTSIQKIKELCGSFVVSDRSSEDETCCKVKLFHKTLYDFFLQDMEDLPINTSIGQSEPNKIAYLREFFVNPTDASLEIGLDCLWFLRYDRYKSVSNIKALLDANDERDAFLKYAATFWFQHLYDTSPSKELFRDVCAFLVSSNFWTSVGIQTYTAPHLFCRCKENSGYFKMCLDDPTISEDDGLGVPLPKWLRGSLVGEKLDQDFCSFLSDWHKVLAIYPGVLDQCVSLNKMKSHLGAHPVQSDGIRVFNVGVKSNIGEISDIWTNPPLFYKNGLHVELLCSYRMGLLEEATQQKFYYYRIPIFSKRNPIEQHFELALQRSPLCRKGMSVCYRTKDSKIEMWNLDEFLLRLEQIVDGCSNVSEAPTQWPKSSLKAPWRVAWKDNVVTFHRNVSLFHLFRGHQNTDEDDKFDRDLDDGSDKFSSDDENDSSDSDLGYYSYGNENSDVETASNFSYDNREDNQYSSWKAATAGTRLVGESIPPLWALFDKYTRDIRGFSYTFHPQFPIVIWSYPGVRALVPSSVCDIDGWRIERLPGDLKSEHAYILFRQLRFSTCGKYLYCLDTSFRLRHEHSCQLTLSTYSFAYGRDPASWLKSCGLAQQVTYRITERLETHPLNETLTYWGEDELVVSLPPLTCRPKLIKFSLYKESSSVVEALGQVEGSAVMKTVQVLREPIYFPSFSGRDPRLMYQAGSSKDHELFLYLTTKPWPMRQPRDGETSAAPPAPVVIRWKISREGGWRIWDADIDGKEEDLNQEMDLCPYQKWSGLD
ncbi:uncharacterized protein TRUGW13939_04953 [Talaromyces rugulosus]|uniref:NACHT domain-containing protein n=1 Tax=Talaromyces rugulosus TaxID=121627 RepID=A0A7H8QYJ8_TALRU|nr:uncharacterized protein TRUGW13939_04953 [Talaromyces rugulosus]QKX57833.1 hypothetical protein TRUGW13939_04953 [Talaromyces rugulosus]